jgi:hypothetical protein
MSNLEKIGVAAVVAAPITFLGLSGACLILGGAFGHDFGLLGAGAAIEGIAVAAIITVAIAALIHLAMKKQEPQKPTYYIGPQTNTTYIPMATSANRVFVQSDVFKAHPQLNGSYSVDL